MASKRVLIVDDEENIGRSLRMILEREGYAVSLCRSAAEFQAHPDARRADAYLFDVRLPDGNGIDLLRGIRHNEVGAPVIMISGHGTIADAVAIRVERGLNPQLLTNPGRRVLKGRNDLCHAVDEGWCGFGGRLREGVRREQ